MVDFGELFVQRVYGDRETIRSYLPLADRSAGGSKNFSWTWCEGGGLFGFKSEAAHEKFVEVLVTLKLIGGRDTAAFLDHLEHSTNNAEG